MKTKKLLKGEYFFCKRCEGYFAYDIQENPFCDECDYELKKLQKDLKFINEYLKYDCPF